MSSPGQIADAAKRSQQASPEDIELANEAELLVAQHGENAGTMAARRADALFREGNLKEGARWLAIFRKIALTHPRRP